MLSEFFGIKPWNAWGRGKWKVFKLEDLLGDVCRNASHNDLPVSFDVAAYGIGYAIQTGRISAEVELKIRALSPYSVCKLVEEIASKCTTAGDVPAFLTDKFFYNSK